MGNPILRILIDLTFDKKEILGKVSEYIDKWREIRKIKLSINRDQISKFQYLCERVGFKKGLPKRTFRGIASELRLPITTVISQFKRAHELLYNKPYEATDHRAIRRSLVRKTTCKDCSERSTCKIPCPDVQIQLEEFEGKQAHKLAKGFFDRYGKEKSEHDVAIEQEAYRQWQEEESK